MLQSAANDACSWWWASHLRTKQSKWIEQSLQDMEVKVQDVLKLISEDGDSFAKRAEMYYKKRPELIQYVEESFRAFRALAERYDHLSKDLQNANHTLGTVCPEKLGFSMDEDDEYSSPGFGKNSDAPKLNKAAIKYLKHLKTTGSEQLQTTKYSKAVESNEVVGKSGLSKSEALEQIDKLQKEILVLQTVKEFVKTSYESGIAKYWGIENQMMEMQQKLCRLQDEFNIKTVVEDAKALTLMAKTALKSCEGTLIHLHEKQERYIQEAREEYKKIEDASRLLKSLRPEHLNDETDKKAPTESSTKEVDDGIQEEHKVKEIPEKKDPEDPGSSESLTVTELTEKIDELVNKVISLETGMSSQTVLMIRLRTEADDLHAQIRDLENEKETLINGTHYTSSKVNELEEKVHMLQELNKNVEDQNNSLHMNFVEARTSLDHLSEKLTSVKPDEAREVTDSLQDNKEPAVKDELQDALSPGELDKNISASKTEDGEQVKDGDMMDQGREASDNIRQTEGGKATKKTVTFFDPKAEEEVSEEHSRQRGNELVNNKSLGDEEKKEELNWQLILLNGLEDREKIMLKEYAAILRNYKDVKRKLSDKEKKDKDVQFETTVQMRGMKNAIAKRDAEIRQLSQKLNLLQGKLGENNDFEWNGDANLPITNEEGKIKYVFIDKDPAISVVEEKLQRDIDALLDGNLDFWLRFSTASQQIKNFKTDVQGLRDEVAKLNEKKKQEGSIKLDLKPDCQLIYKHLRERQTELTAWVEQNESLKNELNCRFESLYHVEEEIKKAFEGSEEDEIILSSYRAAKFQGEILNMIQEYKKIEKELQAGFDHVTACQLETKTTLQKLNNEFGISGYQQQSRHSMNRPRVPLQVFIFGTKPKKYRHSFFSCIRPNRKFQAPRGGIY